MLSFFVSVKVIEDVSNAEVNCDPCPFVIAIAVAVVFILKVYVPASNISDPSAFEADAVPPIHAALDAYTVVTLFISSKFFPNAGNIIGMVWPR